MFTWHAHEKAVTALAFGPYGRFLVSAGVDECVKVWDPIAGAEQENISLRYPDHTDNPHIPPHLIALSADGSTAAFYQYTRRQDFHSQRLVSLNLIRNNIASECSVTNVLALKRSPDGQAAVALNLGIPPDHRAATVRSYDFATLAASVVPVHYDSAPYFNVPPRALAFAPDGSLLAVGTRIYRWPLVENAPSYHIYMKNYIPEDLAFSADNSHLFALVGGKIVVCERPNSGHGYFETKLKGHNGRITAMALTPDGRRLWTASRDATVKCWDTATLTLDRTYTFQTGGLDCLAVSPDGNVAAVGSGQKGTITLWDLG